MSEPPAGALFCTPEGSNPPRPSSVSRVSRRDLQRPGSKRAPQRIDKACVQKIGPATQPLREIGFVPFGSAGGLCAGLAGFGYDSAGLDRVRNRIAPCDCAVAGGSGQNKAFVAIKYRKKLRSGIRADIFSMIDRPSHGFGQRIETIQNLGVRLSRHQSRGRSHRSRQRKG